VVASANDPVAADPSAPATRMETTTPTSPLTPQAGPPMSDADFEALMGQALAVMEQLGEAIEKNATDCAAMATAVDKVTTDNQEFLTDAKRLDADPTIEQRSEVWMEQHKDRLAAVAAKMMGGMEKCSSDPRVQAAFEKLDAS
jgi:hypothetical protein